MKYESRNYEQMLGLLYGREKEISVNSCVRPKD